MATEEQTASAKDDIDGIADMIDAAQVARMLDVHRTTLSKLHAAGRIPAPRQFGARQRWSRAELLAWWEAGCPTRKVWEERKRLAR